jgi:hypothetical protein
MKNTITCFLLLLPLCMLWSCKKDNYPGAQISPFVSMYDIRNLYKGQDVTLTIDNMGGSANLTGMVVSDHSGNNLPAGLLILQDSRRLSQTRGIALSIGEAAANYQSGDSIIVKVAGALLTKKDGILQITGVNESAITKVSSGNTIPVARVTTSAILANPGNYESTLSIIVKGGFDPLPKSSDVLAGNKNLNDGFGNITLHTEDKATFAGNSLDFMANYYGIVFNTTDANGQTVPQLRLRTAKDIVVLSSSIDVTPAIITGFASDVKGSDGNYEYIQLMATRDIDFSVTPFAVVTTNNAGASTPSGYPANGWATGDMRTFKFNLSSGFAAKGTFFYVGGAGKMINGSGSTSMAGSNWIRAFDYTTKNGDGFGKLTTGLLANSGNAFGMAVFQDSLVTANSKPIDAIFVGASGSLYTPGPPAMGYRIPNSDFYDIKNPITLEDQPYYRSGTNTLNFNYNTADVGYFYMLGGVYNTTLGRWTTARTQTNVLLSKTSALTEIEGQGATQLR